MRILPLLLLLFSAPLLWAQAVPVTVATWTFDNPADRGNDDSANGNSLTEINTPTSYGGAEGYVVDFENASSQMASVADAAAISGSAANQGWCVWADRESFIANSYLYKKGFEASAAESLMYNPADATLTTFMYSDASNQNTSVTSYGAGRHLACNWWDSGSELINITLDAGTPSTVSLTGQITDDTGSFNAGSQSNTPVGEFDGRAGPYFRYKGSIPSDDSIWNSGKGTTCENAPQTNLVACWNMVAAGGPYVDSIGSLDLTAQNTPGRMAALVEQDGSGMSVHGIAASTQRLTLVDNADISTGDIDFSVVCWANALDVSSVVLMDKNDEYQLGIDAGNDFYFKGGAGASDTATDTGVTVVAGVWHLVAGGYDGTNYWLRVDSGTRVEDVAGAAPSDTANGLAIMSTTAGASYWDGEADACFMTKASLTDAELDIIAADHLWYLTSRYPACSFKEVTAGNVVTYGCS